MPCRSPRSQTGQPFPRSGPKTILVDAGLPASLSNELGRVFSYKLTSVATRDGLLVQEGCAPNYQGDRITLCTCMHSHRTWPSIDVGTWIAGFTDNYSGNWLFYLMRVQHTATSFDAMWRSGYVPNVTTKSATTSIFGDVYEPVSVATMASPYDPMFYRRPVCKHKHLPHDWWHKDIKFRHWQSRKRHKLLIGEPSKSFLWERPQYRYKYPPHPRFRFHNSVASFVNALQ
jgi:hypothetical protein